MEGSFVGARLGVLIVVAIRNDLHARPAPTPSTPSEMPGRDGRVGVQRLASTMGGSQRGTVTDGPGLPHPETSSNSADTPGVFG